MANKKTTKRVAKARKPSMMSTAFELIRKGRTNEQVLKVLVKEFHLKDEHRHYVSWFRSTLVRQLQEEKASKKLIEKIRNGAHGKRYERGMSLKQLVAVG